MEYKLLVLLLIALLTSSFSNAGEADLSWTPPTTNTDGTPLTDLTSYEVWHGCQQSGTYDAVEVVQAPTSSHTVLNLPDTGTCYFAAKATNSVGESSVFSGEVTKLMGLLSLPGVVFDTAVTWQESPPVSDLEITNTLPADYEWGIIDLGELLFINRDYVFTEIPGRLIGLDYLRTSNSDKRSTDPNSISFDVSRPVTVLVALDRRILPIPSWLNSWVVTGEIITKSPRDSRFNLYSKDFPAGAVILGGNEGDGPSMYSVIVK